MTKTLETRSKNRMFLFAIFNALLGDFWKQEIIDLSYPIKVVLPLQIENFVKLLRFVDPLNILKDWLVLPEICITVWIWFCLRKNMSWPNAVKNLWIRIWSSNYLIDHSHAKKPLKDSITYERFYSFLAT